MDTELAPGVWNDYRENLTLDEIRDNDQEMFRDKSKKIKRKIFPDGPSAMAYVGDCMEKVLGKLGVPLRSENPKMVDKALKRNNIIVENRTYSSEDEWESGVYIYKDGELADFISRPLVERPSWLEIDRTPRIVVKTSVQV